MVNISEKDLYDYTFNQRILSNDKIRYIDLNKELYKEDLDLLGELKEQLNNSVDELIIVRINEKIENHSSKNQIILKKRNINKNLESLINEIDFSETETGFIKDSYWDELNNVLGKVISTKGYCKVYIFSKHFEETEDLKITLYPSGSIHYINISDLPLIIKPKEIIDKIIVQVLS